VLIDPGKPWQNGIAESFNGKFRDECSGLEWFPNRVEAKAVIETWRRHYNEVRPHSRPGYPAPAAFMARLREQDAADRCGIWGLHVPPRRISVPQGAWKGRIRGSRLKLSAVRKNRASHGRWS